MHWKTYDIGGPTMIRAAAKNFPAVLVVVDPADYGPAIDALKCGKVDMELRKKLAQKAFQHVALYDTAISQYLLEGEKFPDDMTIALQKCMACAMARTLISVQRYTWKRTPA